MIGRESPVAGRWSGRVVFVWVPKRWVRLGFVWVSDRWVRLGESGRWVSQGSRETGSSGRVTLVWFESENGETGYLVERERRE